MTFWLVLAALTIALIAMVCWPILRRRNVQADGTRATLLAALEKAEAAGDDEAMRVELSRRLIAHDREHKGASQLGSRRWGVFVIASSALLIPLGAIAVYAFYGAYGIIDLQQEDNKVLAAVAKVEAQLAETPDDWRGWSVVAPVYRSRGAFDKADDAYAKAVALSAGQPASQRAEWAASRVEIMAFRNEGTLPAEAKPILAQALAFDPNNTKARYFDALFTEQNAPAAEAAEKWQEMLAFARANGLQAVGEEAERRVRRLVMVENDQAVAPDQGSAIADMVAGLDKRLAEEGGSSDEWLRLVRAYGVLGDEAKLAQARQNARAALAEDQLGLQALDALEKELGL